LEPLKGGARLWHRLIAAFVSALLTVQAHGSASERESALQQWLSHLAQSLQIPASAVGLALEPLGVPVGGAAQQAGSQPLRWMHRADEAMNPASTIKLLTSLAALELLGPGLRWKTEWRTNAPMRGESIDGDLVLRGSGDPKFLIEDLRAVIAALRGSGLRELRGDLVLDGALYEPGVSETAPIDGDAFQPYNVAPMAADLNFRATRLAWGGDAPILADPPLSGFQWVNRLAKPAGPCRDASVAFRLEGARAARELIVEGRWPRACGRGERYVAFADPVEFAEALFRAEWSAQGGIWIGSARRSDGAARTAPHLLLRWESRHTLLEVVQDVNKRSNNLLARHLWLQLSAGIVPPALAFASPTAVTASPTAVTASPASVNASPTAVTASPAAVNASTERVAGWLASRGVKLASLTVENGSGLSRLERISARDLNRILRLAQELPSAELFRDSLPLAGVDGTMERRITEQGFRGRLWLKTGSLNEVRALSGYVDARSGTRYALSLMINHPRAQAARQAIDTLLRIIVAAG
jgi:D-alanyl-D-alanine carboxypeptidase/D-alanyl-D-alanine-endopeptidase (penicillin-binding protein 4)